MAENLFEPEDRREKEEQVENFYDNTSFRRFIPSIDFSRFGFSSPVDFDRRTWLVVSVEVILLLYCFLAFLGRVPLF